MKHKTQVPGVRVFGHLENRRANRALTRALHDFDAETLSCEGSENMPRKEKSWVRRPLLEFDYAVRRAIWKVGDIEARAMSRGFILGTFCIYLLAARKEPMMNSTPMTVLGVLGVELGLHLQYLEFLDQEHLEDVDDVDDLDQED